MLSEISHNAAEVLNVVRIVVFFAVLLVASWTDIRKGKIYDWLTLPAIMLGLAIHFIAGGVGEPLLYSVIGAVIGGGVFWAFYLFDAVGGGDVKLMAAVGALMGFPFVVEALMVISIVGAFMALLVLVFRRSLLKGLKESAKTMFFIRKRKVEESARITLPYGVAIASGSLITWALMLLQR